MKKDSFTCVKTQTNSFCTYLYEKKNFKFFPFGLNTSEYYLTLLINYICLSKIAFFQIIWYLKQFFKTPGGKALLNNNSFTITNALFWLKNNIIYCLWRQNQTWLFKQNSVKIIGTFLYFPIYVFIHTIFINVYYVAAVLLLTFLLISYGANAWYYLFCVVNIL